MSSIESTLKSPKVILTVAAASVVLVATYSLLFSIRDVARMSAMVQLLLVLSPVALALAVLWFGQRPRPRAFVIALVTSVCMAALFMTLNSFVWDWLAGILLFPLTFGVLALCTLIMEGIKQKWAKVALLLLLPTLLWVIKIVITVWYFYQMRG